MTPGKVIIRRPSSAPGRAASTVAPKHPAPLQLTLVDDARLEERRVGCLGDGADRERCHYAHEGADGVFRCKKLCCGPLAHSISGAIRFVEIRCPLRRPRWK